MSVPGPKGEKEVFGIFGVLCDTISHDMVIGADVMHRSYPIEEITAYLYWLSR